MSIVKLSGVLLGFSKRRSISSPMRRDRNVIAIQWVGWYA